MYKKIKNVRYSPTKNKEKVLKLNLKARRNKLLSDSDWMYVDDGQVKATTKAKWSAWRRHLRRFDPSQVSHEEYKTFLDDMEDERDTFYVQYTDIVDETQIQRNLTELLYTTYNTFLQSHYSPSVDIKYNECLDILADYIVENNIDVDISSMSITGMIDLVESFDQMDIDISDYPFINVNCHCVTQINRVIIKSLTEKMEQFNFHLQAEKSMVSLLVVISVCDTIEYADELRIEILGKFSN
jgi:hypothetical protein